MGLAHPGRKREKVNRKLRNISKSLWRGARSFIQQCPHLKTEVGDGGERGSGEESRVRGEEVRLSRHSSGSPEL